MKKLLVMVSAITLAFFTQAASYKWSAGNVYNGAGDSASKYTGTAYLFDNATMSQAALYAAICDGSDWASKAVTTMAVTSGSISASASGNQFDYGTAGNAYSFYFAIVEDDKAYFSNIKPNQAAQPSGTTTIAFGSQAPTTGNTSKSLPTATYEGAGQWAQTVPEPTSGLLLLLGMAGLALKRKQA